MHRSIPALAAALTLAGTTMGLAQVTDPSVELNGLATEADGCRATFVTAAPAEADLEALSVELAVFDANGIVGRLVVLEFGVLGAGGTRVVQFDLDGLECAGVQRLLVNRVADCTLSDGSDCAASLVLSNRTDIPFGR
jgi:hypothetical protein